MASVNFAKAKGSASAKAYFRHDCMDTREKGNHTNTHIHPELTKYNYSFNGLDYNGVCERYDRLMAEIDKTATNKRKDRVTCVMLETAVPEALTGDTAKCCAWFKRVTELMCYMYGAENLIYAEGHVDEVHDYIDPATHETVTSREHLHAKFIPCINGQLNAKKFCNRSNIIKMNNAIEKMTQEEFGCKFMTGKKAKRKSVEQLKAESLQAEIEMKQTRLNSLHAEVAPLQNNINALTAQRDALQSEIDDLEKKRKDISNYCKKSLYEANNALQEQFETKMSEIEQTDLAKWIEQKGYSIKRNGKAMPMVDMFKSEMQKRIAMQWDIDDADSQRLLRTHDREFGD